MSPVLEEIIEKVTSLSEEEKKKLIEVIEKEQKFKKQTEHRAFIRSLKGKYKDGLSSVDEFIARKQEEIDREDRGWQPKK